VNAGSIASQRKYGERIGILAADQSAHRPELGSGNPMTRAPLRPASRSRKTEAA
jgi:hypothetical protein